MQIVAYMLSCPDREAIRSQTLANLGRSDWGKLPKLEIDQTSSERRQERQEQSSLQLLKSAVAAASEFILFLEDDLVFNRHLRYNLERWPPLAGLTGAIHFFGSLYNPTIGHVSRNEALGFFVANPECVYGSQAFVLSLATTRYVVEHWDEVAGMQDIRMSRIAARVCPLYYHIPSLVQHIGKVSVWGGHYHWTNDFQAEWKAGGLAP